MTCPVLVAPLPSVLLAPPSPGICCFLSLGHCSSGVHRATPPPFKSVRCHLFDETPAPPPRSPWAFVVPLALVCFSLPEGSSPYQMCYLVTTSVSHKRTPLTRAALLTLWMQQALTICRTNGMDEGVGGARSTGVREGRAGPGAVPSPPCTSSGCISP